MKKLCELLFLISLVSCTAGAPKTIEEIATLESRLAEQPSQEILQKLLVLYQDMAGRTEGEERLDYLWNAGETARAAREFTIAEQIFRDLYENHTNPEMASKALFLHAFMCDEDLKEYDKAKLLYTQFLKKYPDSDFSDDAQFLMDNLGKTDEEMLELLSKSKNASSQ